MDQLQHTITDILVENIRKEIIQGTLAPGDRLHLRDLAQKYNVSTMPIREALHELESEGIVSSKPRKGAFVTRLSVADIEDIYAIRSTLEAMATRLAVPNLDEDILNVLSSLVDQMDQNLEDVAELVQINDQFHMTIYAAANRKHLAEITRNLRYRTHHYLHAYMINLKRMPFAQKEHRAIVEACIEKNVEKAGELMDEHVTNAGRGIVEYLKREES